MESKITDKMSKDSKIIMFILRELFKALDKTFE